MNNKHKRTPRIRLPRALSYVRSLAPQPQYNIHFQHEDALKRLNILTQEENLMTTAATYKVVRNIGGDTTATREIAQHVDQNVLTIKEVAYNTADGVERLRKDVRNVNDGVERARQRT